MTVANYVGPRCDKCGKTPNYCPCPPEAPVVVDSPLPQAVNVALDEPPFKPGQRIETPARHEGWITRTVLRCERRVVYGRVRWVVDTECCSSFNADECRVAPTAAAAPEAKPASEPYNHEREMGWRYAQELDRAAEILKRVHPMGAVMGIGRLQVVKALEELHPTTDHHATAAQLPADASATEAKPSPQEPSEIPCAFVVGQIVQRKVGGVIRGKKVAQVIGVTVYQGTHQIRVRKLSGKTCTWKPDDLEPFNSDEAHSLPQNIDVAFRAIADVEFRPIPSPELAAAMDEIERLTKERDALADRIEIGERYKRELWTALEKSGDEQISLKKQVEELQAKLSAARAALGAV